MNMNLKRSIRLTGLLLAVLMLVLPLAACKDNNGGVVTTEPITDPITLDPTPENPVLSADNLTYLNMEGKTVLRAAYVGRKASTPMYTSIPDVKNAPKASVGATWTETTVTVYVTYDAATSLSITLGSATKTPALGETAASAEFTFAEIGSQLVDLGQNLPLTVTVGNATASAIFDGFACLRDYSTFEYTDASKYSELFNAAKLSVLNSTRVVNARADIGAKSEDGAILMYDRYSNNASYNYANLRNYISTDEIKTLEFSTKIILAEFDLNIKAMPEMEWSYISSSAAYGLSFVVSEANSEGDSYMVSFINTSAGIALYCVSETEGTTQMLYTGKQVGEDMHIGLIWASGTLEVYINGYYIGSFSDTTVERSGFGDNAAGFIWQRANTTPSGSKDNFEAEIDNLGFASVNNYEVIQTLSAKSILGEDRRLEGEGVYLATQNLTLPATLENSKYGINAPVYWKTSDASIIAQDGTLVAPKDGAGKLVSLTAYLADNNVIVSERSFLIFVKAETPSTNVLLKAYDEDPYTGSATTADNTFIIDNPMGSIVYDMGSKTKINRAVLTSIHEKNRLTGNFVALYVSDDNKTYTAVEEFCMLHSGTDVHFFNFDVEARYLKIHFTVENGHSSFEYTIYNSLQRAMTAYYSTNPLLDGGASFAGSTTVTVVNDSSETVYNKLVTYTLDQLGVAASALKADLSDIRFRANGKECPHYYTSGRFFVRVPEVPANGSVTVSVLYGNASAQNISNATTTLEIEYGTKVVTKRPGGTNPAWRNSVAVMPNGSLCRMGPFYSNFLGVEYSYDGGHTWTDTKKVGEAIMSMGGGFIVDYENNKVYYLCYGDTYTWIISSSDSGQTWEWSKTNRWSRTEAGMSYSDGIKLSCYDGTGPNVDYVITYMHGSSQDTDLTQDVWTHGGVSSIYSVDGGATWLLSESVVNFGFPAIKFGDTDQNIYWTQHEGGMSEETVWEKEDGTLIVYARQQSYDENGNNHISHFAVAYSYDHGITWDQESVKTSTVYTSSATQPIIDGLDGTPLLLWGGNNSHGFRSYDRFPLNIAYSVDDAENFIGILDISAQTVISNRIEHRPAVETWIVTNPDIAIFEKGGTDHAYIVITNYFILIENFSNYLYKTKGAYDSFEIGGYKEEGWVSVSGTQYSETLFVPGDLPTLTNKGATDGEYALLLGSQTQVSRSIPYVVNGEMFFDLYVDSFGSGFDIDLQAAYNRTNATISTPIRIHITATGAVQYYDEAGALVTTELTLQKGQNTLSISFNGDEGMASVTANGATDDIAFKTEAGAYVCFIMIKNTSKTLISIDRFGVVDMDE